MIHLEPNEARVLGVLIEKATTTPDQYPLSLNGLTNGANQKNNRDPVLQLSEDDVFTAVESLREKQLVIRVDQVGSRVHKYKHAAGEQIRCSGAQLAILAELLLRGPQTQGELRGRASRMHPIATLDDVQNILRGLMEQIEPLVQQLPPVPGSRAERYAQLLAPDAHPIDQAPIAKTSTQSAGGFADRITSLEAEVKTLRQALQNLAHSIGAPNPLIEATIPSSPSDQNRAPGGE